MAELGCNEAFEAADEGVSFADGTDVTGAGVCARAGCVGVG